MSNETRDAVLDKPLTAVEQIKAQSRYLRGTIQPSLLDPVTGSVTEEDVQLLKFHGIYQYDDRDLRDERRQQKLEPDFFFMIRIRVPGGLCPPAQWLAIDQTCRQYANSTIRITSRQALQLHGVTKEHLRATIQAINRAGLDTIAACGDVNRNVSVTPNPRQSGLKDDMSRLAQQLSNHLLPRTGAYREIWLDERIADSQERDLEPIYGQTYLPRKFKISIAIPPLNDVDVFAQDLSFVAHLENQEIIGYTVLAGGGMGMTHGNPQTFPRIAEVIGFCTPAQVPEVAEQVVKIYRDFGDRTDRSRARLKYVLHDRGKAWFQRELESRLGWSLAAAKAFQFQDNSDLYGWSQRLDDQHDLTLFIENGRVQNEGARRVLDGIQAIARIHQGDFRFTPNQHLIVARVAAAARATIDEICRDFGILDLRWQRPVVHGSMACVALPTCGLAMAEAERYAPQFLDKLYALLEKYQLQDTPLQVRMTGCPNGCVRPYLGEIGLVGKAIGRYNLYLGGDRVGQRLGQLYKENVAEDEIFAALEPLFEEYAKRHAAESFGDFVWRFCSFR